MDANKTSEYIESYYRTNRSHVAWSFWASMFALIVGLLVLIAGIFLAFSGSNNALSIATTSAGVLTQFISAGFFYIYNKNLCQLNVFYEKLIQNHDLMFAFGLTGHISEGKRPEIIQGIIGALLSRSSPTTEITAELVRALNESKK